MSATINRTRVLAVAVAVAVWLASTGGAAAADAPNYRAPDHILTVGVGEYRHVGDIPGAANDPKLVAALWPYAKETRLVNREATTAGIKAAFGRLKDEVEPGGSSVIFLSGHGGRAAGAWFFCPHDFDPARLNQTQIHGAWIAGKVGELLARGDRVLLVVDACHAGELRTHLEHLLDSEKGELVLLASSVPSQFSIDGGENGLFVTAVAEGLRGRADTDGDKHVTLKELRRYVGWRLRELVRRQAVLPGVAWREQDAVFDASHGVTELVPLTVAREAKAKRDLTGPRTEAEDRVGAKGGLRASDLDELVERLSKPIPDARLGAWRAVVSYSIPVEETGPDGMKRSVKKELQETIVLRLEKGNRYTITYLRELLPDVAGGPSRVLAREVGSGTCRYSELAGSKFLTLDCGNGLSGLTVEAWGERELKLKTSVPNSFTRNWPKGVWTLDRQ